MRYWLALPLERFGGSLVQWKGWSSVSARKVKSQGRWRVVASVLVLVFLWAVIVPAYGDDAVVTADEPAASATVEEAPAEEAAPPAVEAPAEEAAPVEEAPAEEAAPVEEAPAEKAQAEEAPAEEAPDEEAPAEETAPSAELPAAAPAEDADAEVAVQAEPVWDTIELTGGLDMLTGFDGGYIYDECDEGDDILWHFVVTQIEDFEDIDVEIDLDGTIIDTKMSGGVYHVWIRTDGDAVLYPSGSSASAWFSANGNPQFNLSSIECITGGDVETESGICAYKFADENANGEEDDGEMGLGGVLFTLYIQSNGDWIELDARTSASDGSTSFGNYPAGVYRLVEDVPDGWTSTTPETVIFAHDGEEDSIIKFGNVEDENESEICAYKFLDLNGNGEPDDVDEGEPEEAPMADVAFVLEMMDDEVWVQVGAESSGEDGLACFGDFPDGMYRITETEPTGYDVVGDNPKVFEHDGDEDQTVNFGNVPEVPVGELDIDVEKTASVETVAPGGTIIYTIVVTNTGEETLEDILVEDDFDETLVSIISSDGGVVADGTITWSIASLEPDAIATFTYVVMVDSDVADGTIIENTVVAGNEDVSDTDTEEVEVDVTETTVDVDVDVTPDEPFLGFTEGGVTEPFLPFTGAEGALLSFAAAAAGALGLSLRRRSRRMRREQ